MSINAEEASFCKRDSILINTGTPSDESIRSIKEILPVIRKKKALVLTQSAMGIPFADLFSRRNSPSEAVTTVKGNRGEMGLLEERRDSLRG